MKTNSSKNNIKYNEEKIYSKLSDIDFEQIARETRFTERRAQKITAKNFLVGFFLMAFSRSRNSLESWAGKIGFLIKETVSKQAIYKKIKRDPKEFLKKVLEVLINKSFFSKGNNFIKGFKNILIQDSTHLKLDSSLYKDYPGSVNQNIDAMVSNLKIQAVYNAVKGCFKFFEITGYRDNDQGESPNILQRAVKGDLVIRDLGYFVLKVFEQMISLGIYFISRLQFGVNIYDSQTKQKIDLLKLLKSSDIIDQNVLLGKEAQLAVRFIAEKLDKKTANQKRKKARSDKRKHHWALYYELLGWNILITNISKEHLMIKEIMELYQLRFRIEVIFKSWKSYFQIRDVSLYKNTTAMESYIYCMLIFIIIYQMDLLKYFESRNSKKITISILKYSRFMADNIMLIIIAEVMDKNIFEGFLKSLFYYCNYQPRHDRINFNEKIKSLG